MQDNVQFKHEAAPRRHRIVSLQTYDTRFRALIGRAAWESLPAAVQRRFSKRLGGDQLVLYPGTMRTARFSRLGWLFAQACRVIGAPLPLHTDCGRPAAVSVAEDAQSGGQCWTRIYGREHGFPQVIHSAKRFAGPTGLEEYVGRGVGMALTVAAVDGGLEFVSDHYFFAAFGKRWRIPRWLEPGRTVVRHIDRGDDRGEGAFLFSLSLHHPWFGELVYQEGEFRDG